MNPSWVIRTGRLVLRPVAVGDLPELTRLKGDPRVFAVMLGGVRTPERTREELAEDIFFWAKHGVGMWTIRDARERFVGIVGFMGRTDGRGIALRFALKIEERGHGYASEAAGAALRFAHERGGLQRVVAVARDDNINSREVLGAIGMRVCETFQRDGHDMLVFESVVPG